LLDGVYGVLSDAQRMRSIEEIREMLSSGSYSLSRHALRRMIERNISDGVIRQIGATVEIIEDYPDDKYSPSCLLVGFATGKSPLHLQVSRAHNPTVRIITVYVPSLDAWELGFTKRK
jgi:DNA-binding Lrp family transcriptional regulator